MIEITEEILNSSEYFYDPTMGGIWGRVWTKAECEVAGDSWDAMHYSTNGGYAFGDWASAVYPQGEAGSRHISRLIPISRDTYDLAKAENWNVEVIGLPMIHRG